MRTQRCEEDRPVNREQRMKLIKEHAVFGEPKDIRDAATLRLQVLKYELAFVRSTTITDLNPIVVASYPPRLWIGEAISVVMAPDPRTYRLEHNTAAGSVALLETTDRRAVTEKIRACLASTGDKQ